MSPANPPPTKLNLPRRTVLITGCSPSNLGSALALAFHAASWRVFAATRNPSRLTDLSTAGIETLQLDVLSPESIEACKAQVSTLTGGALDMLVNNAGAGYMMPVLDSELEEARKVFELNVFSVISMAKAFVPLLRKGGKDGKGGTLVNNTSINALPCATQPFQGVYNASKAAAASLTETLRLELQPFGIRVVNLITGTVNTPFFSNIEPRKLPEDSLYSVAKDTVEKVMAGEGDADGAGVEPEVWARRVVAKLSGSRPSYWIWEGAWTTAMWFAQSLPIGSLDGMMRQMAGLDVVEMRVKEAERKGRK